MKPNKLQKALPPLFADVYVDQVDVLPDWRYHLVVPYMRLSSSHIAVRDKYRGIKVNKSDLPKDEELVFQVADGFDLLSVESDDDNGTKLGGGNVLANIFMGIRTKFHPSRIFLLMQSMF